MKIELRVVPTPAARDALSRDALITAEVDLDQIAFVLDAESEPALRLLEITRASAGSMFFPVLSFDAEELAGVALLQPQCRKVARETDRDYRLNNERLKAMRPIHVGADFETRLLDRICLGRQAVGPRTIARLAEWTIEYVAAAGVVDAFLEAGLTGLDTRPVFDSRTNAPHAGCRQLYATNLMPPLVRDGSLRRQTAEKGPEVSFAQLGCLVYPAGTRIGLRDFNRTAEPFTWFGSPDWVLTRRVLEAYERSGMKGWAFLPVLEQGTPLQREFSTRFERVRARIASNPRNLF